jgi:predicted Zn-dependent protease
MKKLLLTIAIIIFAGSTLQVFAEDFNGATLTPQDTSLENIETKHASLTKNDLKSQYDIAFDRFVQSNVKAAYDDYKILIETMTPSDYAYMNVAEKMASIGFFDLASVASSKISDKDYSYILVDDIQRFYYPTKQLKKDDELYLAEVFSNITYNDQSREATAELVKNTMLLANSDYANYIVALGYSKSGNPKSALEYINMAISMNPDSINYQKLKAEILAQSGKSKDAIKIVENIKKQPMNSKDFSKKINSLRTIYSYIKQLKKKTLKNYHLGYYYYYEGELSKSHKDSSNFHPLQRKKSTKTFTL